MKMRRVTVLCLALFLLVSVCGLAEAQQPVPLPDVKSMKHLTTKNSDHAPDIPGNETIMDFYSAPSGEIVTVYSYNNRTVAFSVHSNSDVQGTYRFFMDLTGQGFFQQMNPGAHWQLPPWAKGIR
jgi:hypothetical protein